MRLIAICILPCLVLSLAGCGQDRKTSDVVVGKWETLEIQDQVTLEFTKDGKLHLTGNAKSLAFAFKFAKMMGDLDADPKTVPLTYKLPEAEKLEIEADLTKLVEALGGDPTDAKPREVAKLTVNEKELTITSDDEKRLTFKRVK